MMRRLREIPCRMLARTPVQPRVLVALIQCATMATEAVEVATESEEDVVINCMAINSMPLIRRLSVTPYTTCLFVRHIYGFFVRIYMRVCKKLVIYLAIKTPQSRKERKYTWQKKGRISCSRNDCKYTWEKSHVYRVIILKQIADHNLEHLKCPCSVYLT